MGAVNPPSLKSTSSESAAPGICKELIGQSVARLRGCNSGTDESVADRLASDLYLMYEAVQAISELYDGLDDDSQDNGESTKQAIALEMTQVQLRRKQKQHSEHFASFYLLCSSSPGPCAFLIFPTHYFCLSAVFVCNPVAKTQLIRATAAIDSAVFATMQWLASIKAASGCLYTLSEELKTQVKKMGGFFQLLIQVKMMNHNIFKALH